MTYKLTNNGSVVRLSDNAVIPADPGNADYQAYLTWVAAGGAPTPATVPTLDELKQEKGQALWLAMSPNYLYKHYDAGTQSTFLARYIKLSVDPVVNAAKLARLDSVDSWMGSVLLRYYQLKGAIIAAPDNATLDAISWDFPAEFDATDPHVTIPQVL